MIDSASGGLLSKLRQRAELLREIRRFFDHRGFLEVQTPLLSREVIPEEHIEPLRATHPTLLHAHAAEDAGWLQASPEAHMKRLLVALAAEPAADGGSHAIYQITRSFRAGEVGPLHRPEFTIVEWYRVGDDMAAGMDLLDEFCRQVVGAPPAKRTSYQSAFEQYAGIDPHTVTVGRLREVAEEKGISFSAGDRGAGDQDSAPARRAGEQADRDDLLNLLLVKLVEPHLGQDAPEVLHGYPASQSSLARLSTRDDGVQIAERFELYWRGIELANGFHELADATELRERFETVNAARAADGRPMLPLPERFLASMQRGLPPCTGVALGFDRLLMVVAGEIELDGRLSDGQ